MIYTSYFANLRNVKKDVVPIAICTKIPDWYKGLSYPKIAPTYYMLSEFKRDHNKPRYISRYIGQVLCELIPKEVEKELMEMSNGKDVVLLCYEKPSSFCHRNLVKDWFNDNGIRCEEYR